MTERPVPPLPNRRATHVAPKREPRWLPVRHRAAEVEPGVRIVTTYNWRASTTVVISAAAGLAAGVIVATSLLAGAHAASVAEPSPTSVLHSEVVSSSLAAALSTPCPTEDSDDCYWDASTQGNGLGSSFVNVAGSIYPLGQ